MSFMARTGVERAVTRHTRVLNIALPVTFAGAETWVADRIWGLTQCGGNLEKADCAIDRLSLVVTQYSVPLISLCKAAA